MRRVKSQPNIACSASPNPTPYIQTVLDSVIVSKVPISQSISCIVSHKFPDDLINPSEDFVSCLMIPPDINKKNNSEILIETPAELDRRNRLRKQRQHRASS